MSQFSLRWIVSTTRETDKWSNPRFFPDTKVVVLFKSIYILYSLIICHQSLCLTCKINLSSPDVGLLWKTIPHWLLSRVPTGIENRVHLNCRQLWRVISAREIIFRTKLNAYICTIDVKNLVLCFKEAKGHIHKRSDEVIGNRKFSERRRSACFNQLHVRFPLSHVNRSLTGIVRYFCHVTKVSDHHQRGVCG